MLEALEREGEVAAAAGLDDCVDLVHDHRSHGAEHLAAALRREEQVKRLRGGHEDVWRRLEHRLPLGLRRVTATDRSRDLHRRQSHLLGDPTDLPTRLGEVLVDVGAKSLQRRHVKDSRFVRERSLHALL